MPCATGVKDALYQILFAIFSDVMWSQVSYKAPKIIKNYIIKRARTKVNSGYR